MAKRRMFSKDVIDTDFFMDMPATAQALYFHLGMQADDDGFVSSPKRIITSVGCTSADLEILISKEFVILFDSGILAISGWKVNNYLRSDRYTPTRHTKEWSQLSCINDIYTLDTVGIPNGIPLVSTGKDR